MVGSAGDRRGVPHAPAPGALADSRHHGGLCAADGHFQQRSRLAADTDLDSAGTESRPGGAAGMAPQGIHRPGVQVVPAHPAADVANRARGDRRRHRMVGRRTVQRPPRLAHPARLPGSASDRRRTGLHRWPDGTALRHGQRLADRPRHGPAARSLGTYQAEWLLRPDHSQGIRRQGLFSLRPLPGGDEAGHPQRRPGFHRDGAQLARPGRTAVALRH
ncbi:hypothetical protein D3C81_1456860 [compost metagenome]